MKISLIIGTLGRVIQLDHLLESLAGQTCLPHEVFIVDQNADLRLASLIQRYNNCLPLRWLRTDALGLSRARNLALPLVSGDCIAFPDDDCIYPPHLLAQVAGCFNRQEAEAVIIDETNGRSSGAGLLNRYDVWLYGVSYRIFLLQKAREQVGLFDEELGIGAGTHFGSGEESDFLLRCLDRGFRLYYQPGILVDHPAVDFKDAGAAKKAYEYALGRRRVLLKHGYPHWFRMLDAGWPLFRAFFSIGSPHRIRYYWNQFRGRIGAGEPAS